MGADDPVAEHGGLEERQSADMVEVEMAEEDVDLGGKGRPEGGAEGCDAGPRIHHEQA